MKEYSIIRMPNYLKMELADEGEYLKKIKSTESSISGTTYVVKCYGKEWPDQKVTEEKLLQEIVCQEYENWIQCGLEPREVFQKCQNKVEEDFNIIPIRNMINIFEKYLEEVMVDDLMEKIQERYENQGYVVKQSVPECKKVSRSWAEEQADNPGLTNEISKDGV